MADCGHSLPADFLSGPAPDLKPRSIDFTEVKLPGYRGLWAVILDGVLSSQECKLLVSAAEATTGGVWERAMVNIGQGRQAMYQDIRNCGRIIWDSPELVAKLWARIGAAVPEIHRLENRGHITGPGPVKRKEAWQMTRLNYLNRL